MFSEADNILADEILSDIKKAITHDLSNCLT